MLSPCSLKAWTILCLIFSCGREVALVTSKTSSLYITSPKSLMCFSHHEEAHQLTHLGTVVGAHSNIKDITHSLSEHGPLRIENIGAPPDIF